MVAGISALSKSIPRIFRIFHWIRPGKHPQQYFLALSLANEGGAGEGGDGGAFKVALSTVLKSTAFPTVIRPSVTSHRVVPWPGAPSLYTQVTLE